jgi:hypothetical protein
LFTAKGSNACLVREGSEFKTLYCQKKKKKPTTVRAYENITLTTKYKAEKGRGRMKKTSYKALVVAQIKHGGVLS